MKALACLHCTAPNIATVAAVKADLLLTVNVVLSSRPLQLGWEQSLLLLPCAIERQTLSLEEDGLQAGRSS